MASLKDTAHRIDREPVLFLGCSGTEILALVALGALAGLLLGLLLRIITGWWFLILPTLFIGAFLGVWKGAKILQRKKEGKPDGYYGRLLLAQLSNLGISKVFNLRTGYWSIRK